MVLYRYDIILASMRRIIVCLIIVLFLCGCAKLTHLQELLTLKAMSDNRDLQEKYVNKQNASFEKILEAYKNNSLGNYSDKKSIVKAFGEPLLIKEIARDNQNLERWLYRHAVKVNSEKVYLYFDQTGKLIDWEYIQPKFTSQPAHEVNPQI